MAISFFSGIRQSELSRIDWTAVKVGGVIVLEAEIEKRYKRRVIEIQPVLQAWLEPFFGRTGLIMPRIRMRVKISRQVTKLNISYRRNGFRHSFASYRLAQTDSPNKTSLEDGHWAYILERDYMHRVSKEDAFKFFALTPDECGQKDWAQQVAEYLTNHPPVFEPPKTKGPGPRRVVPLIQPSRTENGEGIPNTSAAA
jgi:hypothetical protein